jgi:hypothetical protein
MKKIILTTLAIVLAVSTVLTVTGFAMAENEPTPVEAVAIRMGLAINAPAVAKAGEPLRIQIVTRPGERPVSQAEVWAVDINNTSDVALTVDTASLTQCHGRLLGTTNDRGYVDPPPRIWERGKYLLVAIKPNYDPGFSMIKITSKIPLTLRAPDTGKVNQPVKMQVTNPDGQGVYRVAMFAIPLFNSAGEVPVTYDQDQMVRDAEVYADILDDPEAEAELKADTGAYNRVTNMRRYFIGFTDRNGEYSHQFSQSGSYLLIAAKCGYTPDFHIIKIVGTQLNLRAPDTARIRETVTMTVTDPTGQGVGRVAIFAIPLLSATNDATITGDYNRWLKYAEAYAQMLESPTTTARVDEEIESWDQIRRYFLGFTDRSGNFEHRFLEAGPYLLIAAKCGYTPDFHIIKIIGLQIITPEKVTSVEVKEVTMSLKSNK